MAKVIKCKGKSLLLDTNVLISQINGAYDVSDSLAEAKKLYISALTQAEIYSGTPKNALMDVQEFLSAFTVLPVTADISTLAGAYKSAFASRGLKDLIIAATAQVHQLTFCTENKKDFVGLTSLKTLFL